MRRLCTFGNYILTTILTTVALALAAPASAAVLEEAHSRTELDLPPAVAEAIRETAGATGDHVATATKRPTKVATEPEQAQEAPAPDGPSTAASASVKTPVSAAEGSGEEAAAVTAAATAARLDEELEEDHAMDELLAILDGEEVATPSLSLSPTKQVGTAGPSPLGRAVPVTAFAFLCFLGLLAHPRSRKLALGRLAGTSNLTTQLDEIAMHSTRELGAGQRVVALQIDGYRVLVGVSEGRMDVLHTWEDGEGLLEDVDRMTNTMFDPGMILDEARRDVPAPTGALAESDIAALRARVSEATPSPQELLAAFKKNGPVAGPTRARPARVSPSPVVKEEVPWWMEGASDAEREKIHAQASVTESVMSKLRAARERGVVVGSPSSVASMMRKQDVEEPRRPAGASRGLPRIVLGLLVGLITGFFLMVPDLAMAGDGVQLSLAGDSLGENADANGASTAIKLLITMTMLAVAPAIILSMTSFTRLIVIFSLMRQAVGVQQAPPNQILIGLALFLTWFIMGPTFTQVNDTAVQPYFDGELTEGEALETGMVPMRKFMMKNTRKKDLALFLRLSGAQRPQSRADVPTRALVPAFIISELKTAFQIGFLIYIPFLIIDLVVATVLLAMGMMVLPPVVISLPFKLLLFVFIDGWNLLIGSVVQSFA